MAKSNHVIRIDLMDRDRKHINLMRVQDKITLAVFVISLAVCLTIAAIYTMSVKNTILELTLVLVLPFIIVGVLSCIRSHKWYVLAIIGVAILCAFFAKLSTEWILTIASVSVGIIGVVAVVEVFQRLTFYTVVCSVEYLNIKKDLSLVDRIVAFMFNISCDIDTRNITLNENQRRASIPWGEVRETMVLSFIIGLFVWIYISMNPKWMSFDSLSSVPIYLFALILYIPALVMPFSIFLSLNVRIQTKYRDFTLYSGVKETLKKMAIPVFAAFMYVLVAFNQNNYADVIIFIVLSLAFNILVNGFASILYYKFFEKEIVDDIVPKWRSEFRPVDLLVEIKEDASSVSENVPDTPKRNTTSLGVIEFDE